MKRILILIALLLTGIFSIVQAADKLPSGKTKLLVVEVHADWCPRCHRVTPVFRELQKDYAKNQKLQFVVLDVTSKKSKMLATTQASALGIGDWYAQNKAKTSTVAVFKQPGNKLLHTFANQADKQVYVKVITDALK